MTSMQIRTCLTLAIFAVAGVASAQSGAQAPNSVPATRIAPRPAQAQPQAAAEMPPRPPLHVGVPAPALKVAKWFKGAPVEKLEPGKLYVVEFWATWCGPCRVTIPHMTELAHKYADQVTFIGVSVWERPAEKTNEGVFALVEPFVKDMGEKMDYRVAADGIDRTMAQTWMTAAGQSGIPCAFIISRDGKVAWIGHPAAMDQTLAEVVAGTFDVQAEAQRQEAEWRKQQELAKLEAPVRAALAAGDDKAVVEILDKAIAAQPDLESNLMPMKFRSLLRFDESGAFAYLKTLLENGSIEKNPYEAFNAAMLVSQATDLKNPDYALVVAALEKAKAGNQANPTILALYAEMLQKAGKPDEAAKIRQEAVEKAEAN